MAGSKNRVLWSELPRAVRNEIEEIVGARVSGAENCPGGYSPGLASRLTLADGRQVFAKAINCDEWPDQLEIYRAEVRIASTLPSEVPAPDLLGTTEVASWVVLVFQNISGSEPLHPWRKAELHQTLQAIRPHEAPTDLPDDHPRLGGWPTITEYFDTWAHRNRKRLIDLEEHGLEVANGNNLVHFDLYPHNILLTPNGVYFVDWPHARKGVAYLDVLMVLSTAAWHGIDPEPYVEAHPLTARVDVQAVDAVLAAHAGFCLRGGLGPVPEGLEPIRDYKLGVGLATLNWLKRRLDGRSRQPRHVRSESR